MTTLAKTLDTCAWYGLLATLAVAPTQRSVQLAAGIHVSVVDPLVWLATGCLVTAALLRRDLRHVRLPPLPVFLFLLLAALAVLPAPGKAGAVKDLVQYLEYFLVATVLFLNRLAPPQPAEPTPPASPEGTLFTSHAAPAPRQAQLLVDVFLLVCVAGMGMGLVHYLTASLPAFDVRGAFGNRNVYGGYLALGLPLLCGAMLETRRLARRVLCAVGLLMGLPTLLAGGAFLGVALGLLLVIGCWGAACACRYGRAFAGITAAAGVLLAGLLILPLLPRHNPETLLSSVELFHEDGAPARRYVEWQAAVSMIADHPWRGVGLGAYQENIGTYFGTLPAEAVKAEADSQNLYLVLGGTMGVPGLLAAVLMLLTYVMLALRAGFQLAPGSGQGLAFGAAGSIVAFAVAAVWSPLFVRGIGIPLAFVCALAAVLATPPAPVPAPESRPKTAT